MYRDPALRPLSHQHQHGLALTVIIDRALKAGPDAGQIDELAAKAAAAWEHELQGHFQVEEELLFPAVRGRIESSGLIDDLIAQHREIEALARRVAQSRGAERQAALRDFSAMLHRHIRIEERQLFQQVQVQLSAEEMEELGRRIDESVQRVCPLTGALPWE